MTAPVWDVTVTGNWVELPILRIGDQQPVLRARVAPGGTDVTLHSDPAVHTDAQVHAVLGRALELAAERRQETKR